MYAPPRMFRSHGKHTEVVVIPDAGYATSWEQPRVITFLQKH